MPGTNSSHTPEEPKARIGAGAAPEVEVAEEGDTPSGGAQTANEVPLTAPSGWRNGGVRAEHLPEAVVPAFAEQVQVEFPERGQEAVAVGVAGHGVPARVFDAHPVVGRSGTGRTALEKTVARRVQRMVDPPTGERRCRRGAKDPDRGAVGMGVCAKDGVRVGMGARGQQQ